VLDEILSGKGQEEVVEAIHAYLERTAKDLREGAVPLSQFVIHKVGAYLPPLMHPCLFPPAASTTAYSRTMGRGSRASRKTRKSTLMPKTSHTSKSPWSVARAYTASVRLQPD
jgi:hypothetical protein